MQNIGYARVSTDDQNLDLQINALTAAGCETIFEDRGVSGAVTKRDGLDQALAALVEGDTLVTWRLDRLGRSLPHLIEVVSSLNERGCNFHSLSEAIDTKSSGGKLIFHMMGALAEFERNLISERTIAGLEAAKKRGQRLGRPQKLSVHQIAHARQQIDAGEKTMAEMARLYGVNRSTLWRAMG